MLSINHTDFHKLHNIFLVAILVFGAALRFTGLNWDDYNHYHPDERYISWVATSIEWPTNIHTAFNPNQSSFNPYYWPPVKNSQGILLPLAEPRKFAYGHIPIYLGVGATRLVEIIAPTILKISSNDWLFTQDILNSAERIEYHHLTVVARALTALVDTGTVFMIYLIGKRVFGPSVGLLGMAFQAVNVMHIQLAHFFIVDPYLTFFVITAIYFLVTVIQEGRIWALWVAAISIGLAIGTKFAAFLLIIPLTIFIFFWSRRSLLNKAVLLFFALTIIFVTFVITNPFALLDTSCQVNSPAIEILGVSIPDLTWNSCYLDNLMQQSRMARGSTSYPFTYQYRDTTPFLYHIEMQIRWGMGPALGSIAFSGLLWGLYKAIRMKFKINPSEIVLLSWTMSYFIFIGGFQVKFMRYMLPIVPILMLYAAHLLMKIQSTHIRNISIAVVVSTTCLYAIAFTSIYSQSHPWVRASSWISENTTVDSVIIGEKWDDAIISRRLDEKTDLLGKSGRNDNLQKLQDNLSSLARADYLMVNSNRIYGVVSRQSETFPISSQFFSLLFNGSLGYNLVYIDGRGPELGPFRIWPERFENANLIPPDEALSFLEDQSDFTFGPADESFTVYDQPLVMIFENHDHLTLEEMQSLFEHP
jgi:hypothetical protein